MDNINAELLKIEVGRGLMWTLQNGNKLKIRRSLKNLWIVRTYGAHLLGWVAPIVLIWITRTNRLRAMPFFNVRGLFYWAIGAAILMALYEYSRVGSGGIDSTSINLLLLLIAINLGTQLIMLLINYNMVVEHVKNRFEKNSC